MTPLLALEPAFRILPDELARWLESGDATTPAYRSADLRATLGAALGLAGTAGITRIADISGLDSTGLPVVSVMRPNGRSLSVASGKGMTLPEACASGLVEALELFHAEHFAASRRPREGTDDPLLPDLAALPQLSPAAPVTDWAQVARVARGTEWNSGRAAIVPFDLVHADFRPDSVAAAQFPIGSNGLAGGNSVEEAVLHGLLELVERDAVARLIADGRADPLEGRPMLDWSTVDVAAPLEMRERLQRRGLDVHVHDATSPVGIPAFYCRLVERGGLRGGLSIATDGSGCHLDPAIALRRALTEAVQTRLLMISGARDDIRARHYATRPARPTGIAPLGYAWQRADAPRDLRAALRQAQARLAAHGLRQIIVVDLESRARGLAFVRVIVPGLRAEAPRDGGGIAP
jgi:YcaO-like protein with predicted kinase domain